MSEPLVVLGIGADGRSGLSAEALDHIARAAVLAGGKRHLRLFPDWQGERIVIEGDLAAVVSRLREAAGRQRTVVLASGDPLFHGIGRVLLEAFPREQLLFLPHVSSVQLAFARIKATWNDAVVVSLHGRPLHALRPALRRREPKIAVLTDAKNDPAAIAHLLRETGTKDAYDVWVCENLGAAEERVRRFTPEELPGQTFAPLNVVVLLRGERAPTGTAAVPLLGIPERALHHRTARGGLITRREMRVLALCHLELHPGDVLWDVGAGSGSVAIEAARLSPRLRVFAIEKDADALRNIEANLRAFALPGVQVVAGTAPEVCASLPDPDAVFIGGSGGRLDEVLAMCVARLRPGGRLVMNCITLETLARAWEWFQGRDRVPEVTSVQLAHTRPLGGLHAMEADCPIFVLRWRK
jgi:precorrin-6Y C5,15-methyltransferase (decarboxylating)